MNVDLSRRAQQRLALTSYYAVSGLCMGSWTSRIPTIKVNFDLNEAALGNLLFIMPIASIVGIPFSSWVVARFETRKPIAASLLANTLTILMLGFSDSLLMLQASVFLFAFTFRILNVAINTQSLKIQERFERRIIGSFHAFWSLGSLMGVGISTLMVKSSIAMGPHFMVISLFSFIICLVGYSFLLRQDRATKGNTFGFSRPDRFLFFLGMIILFAALLEGGMYDWSGVYFKEVLKEEVYTLGYLAFMLSMSFSRFLSDRIIDALGIFKTYLLSGSVIAVGILLAVLFPTFWVAFLGFGLVGFGTSSLFPLTFSLAGKSKKYAAGMAISIVTSYSIFGFLIGPALIGHLAHTFGLQQAFILLACSGIMIVLISSILPKSIDG